MEEEEEEEEGEIMVKATAIVHDSHRPGLIYLRCIGIILRTRRVMIPGRPGLPKRALAAKRGCSSRCGMPAPRDTVLL